MRIKRGVRLIGVVPQMFFAAQVADPILEKYGQEGVITSGTEGKHSRNSRHYIGCALDFRNRDMAHLQKEKCVAELQEALELEYYVKLERTHIHIQWNGSSEVL